MGDGYVSVSTEQFQFIDLENSEILDGLQTEKDEQRSSISLYSCSSEPVYQAYFTHMNAGRLKVCLLIPLNFEI